MSQEKTTLEIIATSVEEAVAKGLSQLGLTEDAVEVEVLDSGSKGFLGLGTRLARVRLKLKEQPGEVTRVRVPAAAPKPAAKPRRAAALEPVRVKKEPVSTEAELDFDQVVPIAEQVVGELLEKMRVRALIKAHVLPPSDGNDQKIVRLEVQGD